MSKPAHALHPLHPLIRDRWSPRAFAPMAVSGATLRSLLEAARWAPSCFNEQPWRLLVASRHDDPAGHAALAACLVEGNRVWAEHAPVLMVAAAMPAFARNDKPNRWAPHDLGLALGNLLGQATAMGLVAHAMGGFSADAVRATLGVPDDVELLCMIALGHPGDPSSLPDDLQAKETAARSRRAHDDLFFGATWGTALHTDADWSRLLHAWFGPLDAHGLPAPDKVTAWFAKDPAFDEQLRLDFGDLHAQATRGELDAWRQDPHGALAWIILLDQLSRNLFRGRAETHAWDDMALRAAEEAVDAGFDKQVAPGEAALFYMPFMHAEDLAAQERCVQLFDEARSGRVGPAREMFDTNHRYAIAHRDIVARFGRFPHRNVLLGRESTPEEEAFLTRPGSSF